MKHIITYLCILFWSTICGELSAQKSSKPLFRIPFEKVGSYVVLNVGINNTSNLNFLLDTGLDATLITELKSSDSILVNSTYQLPIKGLGPDNDLLAWISENNTFNLGKLNLTDQTLFILTDDIFNLSKQTGYPINGIMGSELFQNRIVRINYASMNLYIYDVNNFIPPKGFIEIPLYLIGSKMYVDMLIEDDNGQIRTVRMLIDTGAELAAWFREYGENPIPIPKKNIKGYIGKGLNGDIEGTYARISRIWFGGFQLNDVVVSFPDSASIAHALINAQRDGTIGSQILKKFDIIVDQAHRTLYLRPNSELKKRFIYNISGIEIYLPKDGITLPEIFYIRKDSPGEKAGILPGDFIVEINSQNAFKYTLNEVKSYFEKPAKYLTLKLLRNGKTLTKKIQMAQEF